METALQRMKELGKKIKQGQAKAIIRKTGRSWTTGSTTLCTTGW